MRKTALITGITGQDGSYLAELLLEKNYKVHGIIRRSSAFNTGRIDHIFDRLNLFYGDLVDSSNLCSIMAKVKPDEVYNLASQSHVAVSFKEPEYTAQSVGVGTLRLLEAIRTVGLAKTTRLYQASTSELFGRVVEVPQTEKTSFYPRSPYAAAKLYAFWIVKNYREAYDMFACNGILFNHESPRRGGTFITKKVTSAVARIMGGRGDALVIGNLDAARDWGHAKDYVKAMWMMLQHHQPTDLVFATSKQYRVRYFVSLCFRMVGRPIRWAGEGLNEEGLDVVSGRVLVKVSPRYFRPTEVDTLLGDATLARRELGWEPEVAFEELVREMLEYDLRQSGLNIPVSLAKRTAAVCFDFDDTLVLSEKRKNEYFTEVAQSWHGEAGAELMREIFRTMNGDRYARFDCYAAEAVKRGLPLTSERASRRKTPSSPDGAELVADYNRDIGELVGRWLPEVPGASAALEALSLDGIALFVNSATPHDELVPVVRKRGWEGLFAGIMGRPLGEPVHKSKVVNLRKCMAIAGVTASQIVMVGDGETDRLGAEEVGCPFVGVRGQKPWQVEVPHAADDMVGALKLIRHVLGAL